MHYYSSINELIDQGKQACRMLRQGMRPAVPTDYLVQAGYPPREAIMIVISAAWHMCPDQAAIVKGPGAFSHN
jgi:hypothetical protein